MDFRVRGDGSRFFPYREARSDGYCVSPSDERQRDGENRPRPEGLRRKSSQASLSFLRMVPPWAANSASPDTIFAGNAARLKVHNSL